MCDSSHFSRLNGERNEMKTINFTPWRRKDSDLLDRYVGQILRVYHG
jgi:hypothetical protein